MYSYGSRRLSAITVPHTDTSVSPSSRSHFLIPPFLALPMSHVPAILPLHPAFLTKSLLCLTLLFPNHHPPASFLPTKLEHLATRWTFLLPAPRLARLSALDSSSISLISSASGCTPRPARAFCHRPPGTLLKGRRITNSCQLSLWGGG